MHPSKGKHIKQNKKPESYFKKFGTGHQELLHLVANEISQHMRSTRYKLTVKHRSEKSMILAVEVH